jgi:hypothetical protein
MSTIYVPDPPYDYSDTSELKIELPKLVCFDNCDKNECTHCRIICESRKENQEIFNKFTSKIHHGEKVVIHFKYTNVPERKINNMLVTNYGRILIFTTILEAIKFRPTREINETFKFLYKSYDFWLSPEKVKYLNTLKHDLVISEYDIIFALLKEIEEKNRTIRDFSRNFSK